MEKESNGFDFRVRYSGKGNVTYDGYTLNGMIFEKKVPAKANLNGDTEQGVSTYVLIGAAGNRVMM